MHLLRVQKMHMRHLFLSLQQQKKKLWEEKEENALVLLIDMRECHSREDDDEGLVRGTTAKKNSIKNNKVIDVKNKQTQIPKI